MHEHIGGFTNADTSHARPSGSSVEHNTALAAVHTKGMPGYSVVQCGRISAEVVAARCSILINIGTAFKQQRTS